MDLNFILFPSPKPRKGLIESLEDKLFIIPKNNTESIPCLLIKTKYLSKNFIIMFHGNAEDIFYATDMGNELFDIMKMNVLIVEYPGYSIYGGEKSSEKILENTTIVYDYIKENFKIEDRNIFIFGRSIGSSPAIYLASKRKPAALFVVSGFTCIKKIADSLSFLPLGYLIKERFDSINYIKRVTCPTFFIHGQKDPLIPFEQTIELEKNCDCPHASKYPEKMTHNDFDLHYDIIYPIKKFTNGYCDVKDETCQNCPSSLFLVPESYKARIRDLK